jgi:hypothetical protein
MVFSKNIEQFVNKINSFVKKKMKIKEIQDEVDVILHVLIGWNVMNISFN